MREINDDNPIMEREGIDFETTLLTRVFTWMVIGLAITAITSYVALATDALLSMVLSGAFFVLIIIELILVFVLSSRVYKMSFASAAVCYAVYAVLNGLTISAILLYFELTTIAAAFGVTAGMFGAMALYGYVTKKDLTTMGSIAIMALFGLIIASIVNLFMRSTGLDIILTYAGVLIFVALTAYDVQRIKALSQANPGMDNLAIAGALTLYLDFINLFLKILRLMGRRR